MDSLSMWLKDGCNCIAARGLALEVKGTVYNAAEYWQVRQPVERAKNQDGYIQHMVYLVGEKPKERRPTVYAIGESLWYCSGWMQDKPISPQYADFYPYGAMWQLAPMDGTKTLEYMDNPTVVPVKVHQIDYMLGNLDIGLTADNDVLIDNIPCHYRDIPFTWQWLSLAPMVNENLVTYRSDYMLHDKLILWKHNPKRFLWLVRSSGTWLLRGGCPERIRNEKQRLHYSIKHEPHKYYAYDGGIVARLMPENAIAWHQGLQPK